MPQNGPTHMKIELALDITTNNNPAKLQIISLSSFDFIVRKPSVTDDRRQTDRQQRRLQSFLVEAKNGLRHTTSVVPLQIAFYSM